jgi:thiamine pyrophosphate-dependent acetolactate synthase large subunit-like protein
MSKMRRADVLQHFASLRDDEPVVVGPSGATPLVQTYGDDELLLTAMDMPYSTPICLGLALALKDRRIVAVEGDGSMLAGAAVLSTIARYKPPNLLFGGL